MSKVELCDINSCTQCHACESVCPKHCISFNVSNDGFFVPEIDRGKCVECGTCLKSCHHISPSFCFQKPLKTYACWAKNIVDRARSSSGGAFSVIAREIINKGGVVYGACMCEDLKVRHIKISDPEEIIRLQGSKYVQSFLGDVYNKVKFDLKEGRVVLFSGTPCQVAGLYSFLHKKYDRLYTCDMVCHGVPSQSAFDIYIDKIGLKGKCKNFYFRFTKGWGYQLSALESLKTGEVRKKLLSPSKAYYLRAFNKGLMFNEACYSCTYAKPERISDFTLADYWGLGKKIPFNHPTSKGISCLLINNEKALTFFNKCLGFEYEERPLGEAVEGNYNLSHVSDRPMGRESYYEDSKRLNIRDLSKKYSIGPDFRDYLRIIKQCYYSFFR